METTTNNIRITVVYAEADVQHQVRVECPQGATIEEAIVVSRIADLIPGVDIAKLEVGVYGFKQDRSHVLEDNDRVEIYRPLTVSPTEARRLRAEAAKKSDQTV